MLPVAWHLPCRGCSCAAGCAPYCFLPCGAPAACPSHALTAHRLQPPLQVVSKPGATIDDSEMVEGLVLDHKAGGCLFGSPAPPLLPLSRSLPAVRRWGDFRCTACQAGACLHSCHNGKRLQCAVLQWPTVELCSLAAALTRPTCCCAGAAKGAGGPTRIENAKIALIQFQARWGSIDPWPDHHIAAQGRCCASVLGCPPANSCRPAWWLPRLPVCLPVPPAVSPRAGCGLVPL